MYTTNAIESINSSFRKVTKKGAFPNENTLFYSFISIRSNNLAATIFEESLFCLI